MGHEPDRNDWLGKTLRRSSAAAPDACLDAETIAAWADGALNAQAATAIETHASSCPRCMAVLAAMERTAPAGPVHHAWTRGRIFRWLVPLTTAAATAVAIWVVVPDRTITPERVATVQDLRTTGERADAQKPELVPVPVPVPERRTLEQNPAPSSENREPEAAASAAPRQDLQRRDESRRERAEAESAGALLGGAAVVDAPSGAPQAPAAPSAAARSAPSTDALTETARTAQESAFKAGLGGRLSESTAPSNRLVRWRVIKSASIERSTDGGKTWTDTTPVPGVAPNSTAALSVVAVRAVDADRAVVTTSDNTEFYTSDGGLVWTRVQENSPAPF